MRILTAVLILVERVLRLVLITLALHRIHHLEEETAQQSNFGDLFSLWDRLFGTYLREPSCSGDDSAVGVREIPARRSTAIAHLAGAPFGY